MGALVVVIFESESGQRTENIRRGVQVGQVLTSILFYGFGFFVAHGYSEIGLRVVRIISCCVSHNLNKTNRFQNDETKPIKRLLTVLFVEILNTDVAIWYFLKTAKKMYWINIVSVRINIIIFYF